MGQRLEFCGNLSKNVEPFYQFLCLSEPSWWLFQKPETPRLFRELKWWTPQTLGTSKKIIPTKRALPIRFKRRGGQSTFPPSKTRRACHVKWGWKMIQKPLSWPKKHISSHLPHHQLLPELPRHWQWRYATTYHRYIVSVERCHGGHQNDLPAGKKIRIRLFLFLISDIPLW